MTLEQIAESNGIKIDSLKRKLRRHGIAVPNNHEELEADVVALLTGGKPSKPCTFSAPPDISHPTQKKARQNAPKQPDHKSLQIQLSANWLIIVVLSVILIADAIACGMIGQYNYGEKIHYAWVFFSLIGFATGIGSIVTYNRIGRQTLAEYWKWAFGVLQFLVFTLTINEIWFWAEMTMTLMFVAVFAGVQRSIKN